MFTNNEKKILRMLFAEFNEEHSINNIAKKCSLTPNGALKILRKFEKEGILKLKIIANIKSYSINFENEKTTLMFELMFIPELEGKLKCRFEDLKDLKQTTNACILFGSYLHSNKPKDIDILFIIEKNKFKQYKEKINEIKNILPIKLHEILQTKEDFANNILKKDKTILEILEKGKIFWGQELIITTIKNVSQGKTKKMFQ